MAGTLTRALAPPALPQAFRARDDRYIHGSIEATLANYNREWGLPLSKKPLILVRKLGKLYSHATTAGHEVQRSSPGQAGSSLHPRRPHGQNPPDARHIHRIDRQVPGVSLPTVGLLNSQNRGWSSPMAGTHPSLRSVCTTADGWFALTNGGTSRLSFTSSDSRRFAPRMNSPLISICVSW